MSDLSDSFVIQANSSQKTGESLKNSYFSYVFDSFSLFMPKIAFSIGAVSRNVGATPRF